jgi:hypothetical protein
VKPLGFAQISTDGHRLFMKAAPLGPDPVELFAETQERYFVTSAVAIQFVRDNRGAVTAMMVDAPGQKIRAPRRGVAK